MTTATAPASSSSLARDLADHGWTVLRGALPDRDLDGVRAAFAAAVDGFARDWLAAGQVRSDYAELPWHARFEALRREHPASHSHSWRRCIAGEAVWRMWQHPALLAAMRTLIGADLWAASIWNGRPRCSGQAVETIGWHQDQHYMHGYRPGVDRMLSCWLPLVPVDEGSGCLELADGSHRAGARPMRKFPENGLVGLADDEVAPYPRTPVRMQPGDVLIFDELTFHRALPNTAGRTRWSLDLRFCDAERLPLCESAALAGPGARGYRCASADPARVGSFAEWMAGYTYDGEF